jgi:hypothetical protein
VAVAGVLHREGVQVELLAHLLELRVGRILERDPDEAARSREIAVDLAKVDVGELAALLVDDAVDEHEWANRLFAPHVTPLQSRALENLI